ncbi:MAG: alkaline phosphatase family protein [Flammeovirgaceae bacterium]|nr:MAG: alkaline phosphatase family protein [Flammeovirgaceae bacterium]
MRTLTVLALLLHINQLHGQPTVKIAFGSCSRQNLTEQLWNEVVSLKPDLWVWGGDNIYGDTHDMQVMREKYNQQKNNPGYQKLLATCPVTGTWDDHDYGINDGGKFYSRKQESKTLMMDFIGFSKDNSIRNHNGIYNSHTVNKGNLRLKIINLDTRWFRDTVYKEYYFDSTANRRRYRYIANTTGDILGEEQWHWLEQELKSSNANLNIINSSIQVISGEHDFEKWSNFPAARKRLIELLKKYPNKKVLIISGDRHIAEISKMDITGLPYPLYDITSSGLTHTWAEAWGEANQYRVGELIMKKNFGVLEISQQAEKLQLTVSIRGKGNEVFAKHLLTL